MIEANECPSECVNVRGRSRKNTNEQHKSAADDIQWAVYTPSVYSRIDSCICFNLYKNNNNNVRTRAPVICSVQCIFEHATMPEVFAQQKLSGIGASSWILFLGKKTNSYIIEILSFRPMKTEKKMLIFIRWYTDPQSVYISGLVCNVFFQSISFHIVYKCPPAEFEFHSDINYRPCWMRK